MNAAPPSPPLFSEVLGLSVLPDYVGAGDVASGRLRRVRSDWKLRSGGIQIVFPAAGFRPARVSRFVELLLESARARTNGGSFERA